MGMTQFEGVFTGESENRAVESTEVPMRFGDRF